MTVFLDAPTNIDIYVNMTSGACPRVWFSDANGVVLERELDCSYDSQTSGNTITLTYHAPSGYKVTLTNKDYATRLPSWSASCSTTVTGTTTVPSGGELWVADYNVLVCDGASETPAAFVDPKWTIKKPSGGNGYTVHAMSELVRNDNSTLTLDVAFGTTLSVVLTVPSGTNNGPVVGNTLVFRPGVPLSGGYSANLDLGDPGSIGYEWSTDGGASWISQSSDPTVSATTSTNSATTTTILLRKIGATSPFETLTWVLDNRSPSAPNCACS